MSNLISKLVVLILIIQGAISCKVDNTHQHHVSQEVVYFKVPDKIDWDNTCRCNLSSLYSSVSGFELDRNGGPIGRVNKAMICNNILYVLDIQHAKEIFAYDLDNQGRFLFKVGTKGKGPGEFLRITDFTIDFQNNQLLVVDPHQRKVLYFDLNGVFQNETRLNFTPLQIACKNDYLYFMCNTTKGDDMGIKIMGENNELLREYLPMKDYPKRGINGSAFVYYGDKLLLNYPNCDTIFDINKLSLSPYFILDCNGKSYYSHISRNNVDIKKMVYPWDAGWEEVIFPKYYFENNKMKVFTFTRKMIYPSVVQMKNGGNNVPKLIDFHNDICGTADNVKAFDAKYGTISIVYPQNITKLNVDSLNRQAISDQLIGDIEKATMDSNPFVLFYK